MSLQIVRFTTRPERAGRVADQPEFLLLLHLDEGMANPLPAIPRAAFRQQLQGWAAPGPQPVNVLGDYRMAG